MGDTPVLVLPSDFAASIAEESGSWGVLDLRCSNRESSALVVGYRRKLDAYSVRDRRAFRNDLRLWSESGDAGQGLWYRAQPELHAAFHVAATRDGAIPIEEMRKLIPSGWRTPGTGTIILTVVPNLPLDLRWNAWIVSDKQAQPIPLALQPRDPDILAPIAEEWPHMRLASKRIVVIGLGSIGAAASHYLLGFGARTQALVDYDHLLAHNFARHYLDRDQLGRLKVMAMADALAARDSRAEITPLSIEILGEADRLRPLLREADGVLVATDGVASRRVANHLVCWAKVPAVFACELGNGAYGELVRYRPGASGCLWCLRKELVEEGSVDPEPALDRGYGTGNPHLPTTGVGSDLWLVAEFAAKLLVATLLERSGLADQRAPGDHAVIGLRPRSGFTPPFDFAGAGRVEWHDGARPHPQCPSCGGGTTAAA